jgi:hypothetical protein
MLTDREHEYFADAAREIAEERAAPRQSYAYGLKIGRIVEMALASAEAEFIGIRRKDALCVAEAIREAFWSELELPDCLIDHDEVERGMGRASDRYAEAVAVAS